MHERMLYEIFHHFLLWTAIIWMISLILAVWVFYDNKKKKWSVLVALPWLGILFFVIYLTLRPSKKLPHTPEEIEETAINFLNEKLARGEITKREYEREREEIKRRIEKWKKGW